MALAKSPEDRFQSCGEFAEALTVVAERPEPGEAGDPAASGIRPVRRRPAQTGGGSAGGGSGTLLLSEEEIREDVVGGQDRAARWRIAKPWLTWLALGFLLLNGLAFTLGVRSTQAVPEGAAVPIPEIDGRSGAAEAPTSATPESAEPSPVGRTATVHFYYRNRLKNAHLQIRIDGETVWFEEIEGPKNFLTRTVGKQFRTRIEVPEGARSIEVRVTGSEKKIDLIRHVERDLQSGKVYTLQASFVPPNSLKLTWKN